MTLSTRNKILLLVMAVLSFGGFFDAGYLAAKFFIGAPVKCFVFNGCEKVLSSSLGHIGPLPISLFGAIYYLFVLFCLMMLLNSGKPKFFHWILVAVSAGFVFSAFLMFSQFFILKSICFYCVVSAIITTLLFVMALFSKKKFSTLNI